MNTIATYNTKKGERELVGMSCPALNVVVVNVKGRNRVYKIGKTVSAREFIEFGNKRVYLNNLR